MKFYDNIKNPRYEASPFAIDVDGTHLFYTSVDATPFILYQSGIVFGVPGGEHDDIESRNKGKRPLIRGRWWVKANALVLWECTCSYEVKCSFLKKFVGTVKKFGIDGLNIRFFEDFGRFQEKDGERRMQIVIMETTVKEYISLNIQEKEENWFWRTFDSQGKEKSLGGNITKNGMGSRDIWRHYEITESKTNKNMNNNVIINKNMKEEIDMGQVPSAQDVRDERSKKQVVDNMPEVRELKRKVNRMRLELDNCEEGSQTEKELISKIKAANQQIRDYYDRPLNLRSLPGMNESKTSKNMKKNVVKINEKTLRQIVAESVKKVLNEYAWASAPSFKELQNTLDKVAGILGDFCDSIPQEQLDEFMKLAGKEWNYLWESLISLEETVMRINEPRGLSDGDLTFDDLS